MTTSIKNMIIALLFLLFMSNHVYGFWIHLEKEINDMILKAKSDEEKEKIKKHVLLLLNIDKVSQKKGLDFFIKLEKYDVKFAYYDDESLRQYYTLSFHSRKEDRKLVRNHYYNILLGDEKSAKRSIDYFIGVGARKLLLAYYFYRSLGEKYRTNCSYLESNYLKSLKGQDFITLYEFTLHQLSFRTIRNMRISDLVYGSMIFTSKKLGIKNFEPYKELDEEDSEIIEVMSKWWLNALLKAKKENRKIKDLDIAIKHFEQIMHKFKTGKEYCKNILQKTFDEYYKSLKTEKEKQEAKKDYQLLLNTDLYYQQQGIHLFCDDENDAYYSKLKELLINFCVMDSQHCWIISDSSYAIVLTIKDFTKIFEYLCKKFSKTDKSAIYPYDFSRILYYFTELYEIHYNCEIEYFKSDIEELKSKSFPVFIAEWFIKALKKAKEKPEIANKAEINETLKYFEDVLIKYKQNKNNDSNSKKSKDDKQKNDTKHNQHPENSNIVFVIVITLGIIILLTGAMIIFRRR